MSCLVPRCALSVRGICGDDGGVREYRAKIRQAKEEIFMEWIYVGRRNAGGLLECEASGRMREGGSEEARSINRLLGTVLPS